MEDNEKVVTILGGREGVSNTEKILKELMTKIDDVKFMVQCGINLKLYNKIKKIAKQSKHIHALGFVDSMREVYSLSDVIITKPGAITVSELVVSNARFILDTSPIVMPQEKGNVKFVEENKLGLITKKINELPNAVNRLLHDDKCKYSKSNHQKLRAGLYGTKKIGDKIISLVDG